MFCFTRDGNLPIVGNRSNALVAICLHTLRRSQDGSVTNLTYGMQRVHISRSTVTATLRRKRKSYTERKSTFNGYECQ